MRKNRILADGAVYHVTARTNRRALDISSRREKIEFMKVLERTKLIYFFTLHAFNVMGNHIHLLIQPRTGSCLSKIMQWMLSVYAKSWNRRHKTCGHFWGDRFHSIIIESEEHFYRALNYIEENAVRIKLVKSLDKWPFGSWLERRKPYSPLVSREIVFNTG